MLGPAPWWETTPIETVTGMSSARVTSSTLERMRSATIMAPSMSVSGRRTQNSSPPKRAATSYSRVESLSAAATLDERAVAGERARGRC